MLASLSIRDVVLIERINLTFDAGLAALTGETGAGKSILLDALGLALGARADAGLVRKGADQAIVTAAFELAGDHPARAILAEQGLPDEDGLLTLRRVLNADGRSRAFVNDQPASVGLARQIGASLVEVHGQFETTGLLDPKTHRGLLDAFAGLTTVRAATRAAWTAWREAEAALAKARADTAAAKAEEAFLRQALEELDDLAPEAGEEARLAEDRQFMQHRERLAEAITAALTALDDRVAGGLGGAQRDLGRVAEMAGGRLDPAIAALDRASAEVEEATEQLQSLGHDLDTDATSLERVEERLFALRAMARKHGVEVDALADVHADLARRLALIEDQDAAGEQLARAVETSRTAYRKAAEDLSDKRRSAATRLDKAVAAELPPLKLEKARFATEVAPAGPDEAQAWGPDGIDRVRFLVATNPGAAPGPLNKIASGGELARFTLALKVVLSAADTVPTLIFDEVDSGISGAVADAVGERLARLGDDVQVLVVTHSPQVAARAGAHLRVEKAVKNGTTATRVVALDSDNRREEIARMLSGARITDQARAAADSLIAGHGATND